MEITYNAGMDIDEIRAQWEDTAEDPTDEEAFSEYVDEIEHILGERPGTGLVVDPDTGVVFSRAGYEWSALVNELEWAGEESAYTAIEAQLPEGYGDSEGQFDIQLGDTDAHITRAAWERLLDRHYSGDPETAVEVEANEAAANYGG